jgi:hypothetical protein
MTMTGRGEERREKIGCVVQKLRTGAWCLFDVSVDNRLRSSGLERGVCAMVLLTTI